MEGKGWFVIYGLLLFIGMYLGISQNQQGAKITELQEQVATLATPAAVASATPAPEESPSESPAPEDNIPDEENPPADSGDSRDQIRTKDLASIRKALDTYRKTNKKYPNDLKLLVPKQLTKVPQDPLYPKYNYVYKQTGAGFILTAKLETKDQEVDAKDRDGKANGIFTLTEKSPVNETAT